MPATPKTILEYQRCFYCKATKNSSDALICNSCGNTLSRGFTLVAVDVLDVPKGTQRRRKFRLLKKATRPVADLIAAEGGEIVGTFGTSVIGVFRTRREHAIDAVDTALRIHQVVRRPEAVRIGILGEDLYGGRASAIGLTGQAIHAVRMLYEGAQPGQMLMTRDVARQLSDARRISPMELLGSFEIAPVDSLTMAEMADPIDVYELRELSESEAELAREAASEGLYTIPAIEIIGGGGFPSPPPPEPPQPPGQNRFLEGRMPQQVWPGDTVPLEVRISLQRGSELNSALRPFDVPPEGLDIRLVVHTPGLIPITETLRTVRVPYEKDTDWTLFMLKAKDEGVFVVTVSAYNKGAYLGCLNLEVTVDSSVTTGHSVEYRTDINMRLPMEGEVTLEIRYDDRSKSYRYRFHEHYIGGPDEMESGPLKRTPEAAIEGLIQLLNDQARGKTGYTAEQTRKWMRGQGIDLWEEFIPETLRNLFWQRRDKIKKLIILSSGDFVPWELLYPYRESDPDTGFLAEQFDVARWIFAPDVYAPRHVSLSKRVFVSAADGPKKALPEVEELRKVMGGGKVVSELGPLTEILENEDFNLLHFACHNTFLRENPSSSYIQLGKTPFTPAFLSGKNWREKRPVIFMNACRTSGLAPGYTRLTGWADKFLRAHAGAFIGTLWEVRDTSASLFAQEFYKILQQGNGATLAKAMRGARDVIRSNAGDPTWLAYTLYGDPAATVFEEA